MACTKRSYSKAGAVETMDRLIRRWNDGTLQDPCFAKRAYRCPDCGQFHLSKFAESRREESVFPTLPIPASMQASPRGWQGRGR